LLEKPARDFDFLNLCCVMTYVSRVWLMVREVCNGMRDTVVRAVRAVCTCARSLRNLRDFDFRIPYCVMMYVCAHVVCVTDSAECVRCVPAREACARSLLRDDVWVACVRVRDVRGVCGGVRDDVVRAVRTCEETCATFAQFRFSRNLLLRERNVQRAERRNPQPILPSSQLNTLLIATPSLYHQPIVLSVSMNKRSYEGPTLSGI
jgi:hypothetical protein